MDVFSRTVRLCQLLKTGWIKAVDNTVIRRKHTELDKVPTEIDAGQQAQGHPVRHDHRRATQPLEESFDALRNVPGCLSTGQVPIYGQSRQIQVTVHRRNFRARASGPVAHSDLAQAGFKIKLRRPAFDDLRCCNCARLRRTKPLIPGQIQLLKNGALIASLTASKRRKTAVKATLKAAFAIPFGFAVPQT